MDILFKYFPNLTDNQIEKFKKMYDLYYDWNSKINVISRKDFEQFYIHHVLHSLAIAKYCPFKEGSQILDLGTGGGFPAVPLAIFYPEVNFLAVDSIQKKINVVQDIIDQLELKNIKTQCARVETIQGSFDFVITRAVAPFKDLLYWIRGKVHPISFNKLDNGLIALKGGDLKAEIKESKRKVHLTPISKYFSEEFFETKYITYVKL